VEMWFWDADSSSRPVDIEDVNPNLVVDVYPLAEEVVETAEYERTGTSTVAQPEVSLPARATGNQIMPPHEGRPASAVEAAGPGSVTFRPATSQWVQAQGMWQEGRWQVVFSRPLKVGGDGISLAPGQRFSVAFAVWDGGHKDRGGQKLITIWQDLVLQK